MGRRNRSGLLGGAAAIALLMGAGGAKAEDLALNIAPQPLGDALNEFAVQARQGVVFAPGLVAEKTSRGVSSAPTAELALAQLLDGTGLTYRNNGDTFLIVRADDPQSGSAAGDGAGTVEALIVTAQKREEDIQDVPIAISAFTQEDLTRSQVAGGPDLITQVPNMTFTKTNFSSYSVQLRGIGTQAISATTDPAVAVAFNNTPFIRNRFFEQEFYDLQRVEVLRGPQGTLYGRNATAGVVNIISQKPKFSFEAKASGDISNYNSSRIEGMINIPLVEDVVALRLAGAWTKREGYATNEIDGEQIDGRNLWSTRLSLRFTPNDRIDANLIWEHFEEDDDRLRSGKQLCKKHVITEVGGLPVDYYQGLPDRGGGSLYTVMNVQSTFSQGCIRESLYSPDSFQTPNGLSIPYYQALGAIGLPIQILPGGITFDPYLSEVQSRDLRMIESTVDPEYRAKTDIGELQVSIDLSDSLTLQSETAYSSDFVWSTQDFNRFNTAPGAWRLDAPLIARGILTPDGYHCDPQIGCANRLVAVDLSTARSTQFSQELRLSSDFEGPFNFSVGANYLRADSYDKYYVFINSVGLISAFGSGQMLDTDYQPTDDNFYCLDQGSHVSPPDRAYEVAGCVYRDTNPLHSLNDQGHNYFLSNNPYKLISYAVFGETYYQVTDALKVTAGLRWTVDKKEAPRIPSWLLIGKSYGYPVADVIEQEWREPTGRLAIDWKPDLAFTDETMIYGSYAHGYKAGGANPPGMIIAFYAHDNLGAGAGAVAKSATRPRIFDAEYVDALELGTKNTLLDGSVTLNLAGFYYDYENYQISEIVDRSAFNRNFDATVWGIELEADWRPLENLRLGTKIGYEETRIADGESAVDLMDRTAGMPGWTIVRPFPTMASSCILPAELFTPGAFAEGGSPLIGLGGPNGGNPGGCEWAYLRGFDPGTEQPYTEANDTGIGAAFFWPTDPITGETLYPGFDPATAPNNGEGFSKQLGGNELPNAPNMTATITADYTLPLPNEWFVNLHTDLYWQAESDWRVFQDHEYSKLDEYFTMNLAAIFTNEELGWNVMAYVKNVFDRTAITGAFLNSDDTGLTTNVFLTEPRLYGLRVTKVWNGSPWFEGFDDRHSGPAAFTVELGGQVQRHDTPNETLLGDFTADAPEEIDIYGYGQNQDLDWGDGREVKLTWRPNAGPWALSAGVRYGKTNKHNMLTDAEYTDFGCTFGGKYAFLIPIACDPAQPSYYEGSRHRTTIWSSDEARHREEHQFVDFAVSRDLGLGGLRRSVAAVGLRHADFESTSDIVMRGVLDRVVKDGWGFGGSSSTCADNVDGPLDCFDQHTAQFDVRREFQGTGPTASWEAALPLFGGDDAGRLELDWTVAGGVLFGERSTTVDGFQQVSHKVFNGAGLDIITSTPFDSEDPPVPLGIEPRSEDATVYTFGGELGLAYSIDRVRVRAGYRWERYFDVLDVGYDAAKEADRTIDGPYFKLSVGFGG